MTRQTIIQHTCFALAFTAHPPPAARPSHWATWVSNVITWGDSIDDLV